MTSRTSTRTTVRNALINDDRGSIAQGCIGMMCVEGRCGGSGDCVLRGILANPSTSSLRTLSLSHRANPCAARPPSLSPAVVRRVRPPLRPPVPVLQHAEQRAARPRGPRGGCSAGPQPRAAAPGRRLCRGPCLGRRRGRRGGAACREPLPTGRRSATGAAVRTAAVSESPLVKMGKMHLP